VSFLAGLKDRMASGGKLEIVVPNVESGKITLLPQCCTYLDVPRHLSFFSAGSLKYVIEQAG